MSHAFPVVTVHFASAAVEVPTWLGITPEQLRAEAASALARHLGDSVKCWTPISDQRNIADLRWTSDTDVESDAFYLRADGHHGWFNRASWKITQVG